MSSHSATIKVFSRFNRTVSLVFLVVVVVALTLATTRYFRELSIFKTQAEFAMKRYATSLNNKLDHSVKALTGLVEFADYCLKHPDNSIKMFPDLAQDGKEFYLKYPQRDVISRRTQLSGNITGIGVIKHFDLLMQQELAMANKLTPAFITAKHTNPEVTWFYYLSKNHFVNLYPWVSRNSWRYTDKLIERDYFVEIQKKQQSNDFYWSPPFQDSAGKGLTSSLAAGVTQLGNFSGALILDINLNELDKSLPEITEPDQGFLLLDKNQHVLLFKALNAIGINSSTDWHEALPIDLESLSTQELKDFTNEQREGNWFIQKQTLPINGWILIKYQPYHQFITPLSGEFLFWFFLIFSGLFGFISLIYWLTKKTFIKPATEFIQHIENCAQGDSGKIKPTADWLHWFHVVEDIFSQNRSLMQQLKDKNADLDKRVKEKTTDLVKTSEQHQRDYALLRSVMNAMQELIIFSDPKGNLIGCNLALEKFLSKKEHTILGSSACDLLPTPMCQSLNILSQQSYQDSTQKAYQQLVKTPTQTFELFSRRFLNEYGQLLGTINIFRDVTAAYAIQADLEQAKNQAVQANQAKGQFLANMSHEIRTPLNAIQGMMYLLEKTQLNRTQQQYLSNAETASKSLLYLIDELLDLAKIEAGKMPLFKTEVDLNQAIDKALKLNISKAHNKSLPVYVDIGANVPEIINTDEVRFVQVLTNLLGNAIKFTDDGEVKLTVDVINHNNLPQLRCCVIDTGIGIAKEKQTNLFKAFTQADESMTRKYGGSGLGLSICLQIVTLLGGKFELESDEGQGSKFSFVLPLGHEITTHEAEKLSISITSIGNNLPESLHQKLIKSGWHYQTFSQLLELESIDIATNEVLLIDAKHLQKHLLVADNIVSKFSLICLCLPMLTEISETLQQQLEQLEVPWVVIEKPFYRIMIDQIIIATSTDYTDGVEGKVAEPEQDKLAQETILLVEDNLVNQMVAQELLQSMNAKVIIASNGQQAIELLEKNVVDLVLMDIQMPVMDGLTATRKIRENSQYQQLPIIAMTAHAREEDQLQSIAAGMNLHIAKPVTYEQLLISIKGLLEKQTKT